MAPHPAALLLLLASLWARAAATLSCGAAAAQWTGGAGDGRFETAGNWQPQGAPSNTSAAVGAGFGGVVLSSAASEVALCAASPFALRGGASLQLLGDASAFSALSLDAGAVLRAPLAALTVADSFYVATSASQTTRCGAAQMLLGCGSGCVFNATAAEGAAVFNLFGNAVTLNGSLGLVGPITVSGAALFNVTQAGALRVAEGGAAGFAVGEFTLRGALTVAADASLTALSGPFYVGGSLVLAERSSLLSEPASSAAPTQLIIDGNVTSAANASVLCDAACVIGADVSVYADPLAPLQVLVRGGASLTVQGCAGCGGAAVSARDTSAVQILGGAVLAGLRLLNSTARLGAVRVEGELAVDDGGVVNLTAGGGGGGGVRAALVRVRRQSVWWCDVAGAALNATCELSALGFTSGLRGEGAHLLGGGVRLSVNASLVFNQSSVAFGPTAGGDGSGSGSGSVAAAELVVAGGATASVITAASFSMLNASCGAACAMARVTLAGATALAGSVEFVGVALTLRGEASVGGFSSVLQVARAPLALEGVLHLATSATLLFENLSTTPEAVVVCDVDIVGASAWCSIQPQLASSPLRGRVNLSFVHSDTPVTAPVGSLWQIASRCVWRLVQLGAVNLSPLLAVSVVENAATEVTPLTAVAHPAWPACAGSPAPSNASGFIAAATSIALSPPLSAPLDAGRVARELARALVVGSASRIQVSALSAAALRVTIFPPLAAAPGETGCSPLELATRLHNLLLLNASSLADARDLAHLSAANFSAAPLLVVPCASADAGFAATCDDDEGERISKLHVGLIIAGGVVGAGMLVVAVLAVRRHCRRTRPQLEASGDRYASLIADDEAILDDGARSREH